MNRHAARALAGAALLLVASACGNATPPTRDPQPADASASAPAPPAPLSASAPPPAIGAGVPADAGQDAEAPADAGPVAAPFVPDNKVAPTEGPELQERARGLLDAIAKDDPSRGEAFWFPKEAFLPLKDIKDPGKYWEQLHRTFAKDIHALHQKRKNWDGAELLGFDGWSKPKWVPPGDEANKIGYYRAFQGKLRYKAGGETGEIEVRVMITWQGRWYITHLSKFKH